MALTEAVKEIIWLKGLLIELGVNLRSAIVNCDNQSAIHLTRNAMFHERTKHINVRYHFIREIMKSKEIEVAKIGTKDNAADAFTKVVPGASKATPSRFCTYCNKKRRKRDEFFIELAASESFKDVHHLDTDGGNWKEIALLSQIEHGNTVRRIRCVILHVPKLASVAEYFFKMGIEGKRFRPTMEDDYVGPEVEKLMVEISDGDVLLLENVRFYREEDKNDPKLAKKLASLAELYANDALALHIGPMRLLKDQSLRRQNSRRLDVPPPFLVDVVWFISFGSQVKELGYAELKAVGASANILLHKPGYAVYEAISTPNQLEVRHFDLHDKGKFSRIKGSSSMCIFQLVRANDKSFQLNS
ncbi:retrovirus-related pol polyprotein from transposon TNT 1-94 [Tanacetum coccineum]